MTTIAYDGKTLAADKQLTKGSNVSNCKVNKLSRGSFKDYSGKRVNFISTLCGDAGIMEMLVKWFETDGWKMLPKYMAKTVGEFKSEDDGKTNTLHQLIHFFVSPDVEALDFEFMVIVDGHGLFVLVDSVYGFVEERAPYATGNGGQIALGAMLAGKSAKDAVLIASKVDVYTGQGVTTMTLKK